MSKSLQIGIEVELAVFKLTRPIVCSFLPYTKEEPLSVNGNTYHKDASFLELAMRPCSSGAEMDDVYREAIDQATTLLPDGAAFYPVPSAEYTEHELSKDPYASVMGCSPSLNLYRQDLPVMNEFPDRNRYAGMHVNISADKGVNQLSVLSLDAVLGLTSVVEHEQEFKDQIIKRRTVYGRAGEHRLPPFGVEYRTLPASTWDGMGGERLFDLVRNALNLEPRKLMPHAKSIETAINNCDAEAASTLMTTIGRENYV